MSSTPHEQELREQIVEVCRLLHERGYLASNDGNVSVRLDQDRVLITPSGAHKGFISASNLVVVDATGRVLSGAAGASGELALHLTALRVRPDVQAVVHAHPPSCIAVSLTQKRLNGFLPEVTLSIGRMEVVPYARPISDALADSIEGPIARNNALIMQRHGTLTVGKTLFEAYCHTERLEHAAKVLWMAHVMGSPRPLPDEEVRTLEAMYDSRRS